MKFGYRLIVAMATVLGLGVFCYLYCNVERSQESSNFWPVKWVQKEILMDQSKCANQGETIADVDIKSEDLFRKFHLGETVDFQNRSRTERLEVIVVPHAHSDPGWLKTLDEYFVDQTNQTLYNAVDKLLRWPGMTFIWSETIFFEMWWRTLNPQYRRNVKQLIQDGRFEIVGGEWVMTDEATTHYYAIVDQMVEGHQWVKDTLGVVPKNSWSVDPFGHSSSMAYLLNRAGFDNMVTLRVHMGVKDMLQRKQAHEFMWRQHWDAKGSTDILCQIMPYKLYSIKFACGPNPFICLMFDFRKIEGENSESTAKKVTKKNVKTLAALLYDQYKKKSLNFRHNAVLVPLGDDFRYDRPIEWDQQYVNYMKLFKYMNSRSDWNVNARFGTLQDYFTEVKKAVSNSGVKNLIPSLSGDFFPYMDKDTDYWTGYFTTRPYDKVLDRELEGLLRAADILNTLTTGVARKTKIVYKGESSNLKLLEEARRALGLFQHHDAITGTEKFWVVEDYERRLLQGVENTELVMQDTILFLLSEGKRDSAGNSVPYLRMETLRSQKSGKPKRKIVTIQRIGTNIVLYNPVAQHRQELVTLFVNYDAVKVKDAQGHVITCQINPVWDGPDDMSGTVFELAFIADMGPLSLNTVTLLPEHSAVRVRIKRFNFNEELRQPGSTKFSVSTPSGQYITLQNQDYLAKFSADTGFLQTLQTKCDGNTTKVKLNFMFYKSRGSGAYIFYPSGPAGDNTFPLQNQINVMEGPVFEEIMVHIGSQIVHRVRLINSTALASSALEITNVADIQFKDVELIMRMDTGLQSGDTFYTDLNGFQMQKRTTYGKDVPLQANYYPMTSLMYIEDTRSRLSLISAQSLGCASLHSGQMEVMLDRQLTYDDDRGLGEGVEDPRKKTTSFLLLLERQKPNHHLRTYSSASLVANALTHNHNYPVYSFTLQTDLHLRTFSPMAAPLPCDVRLLSFRSMSGGLLYKHSWAGLTLHRVGYDCNFNTTGLKCRTSKGSLRLAELFSAISLKGVQETSLSFLHKKEKLEPSADLRLNTMELHAFNVTFT